MQNRICLPNAITVAHAMRDWMNTRFLRSTVNAQASASRKSTWRDVTVYVGALTLFAGRSAFAQDVLGITPVEIAFIAFLDIVAVIGIGWGFTRLMTGRHTVEGLFAMGVGVLGIAKAQTIVTFLSA